MTDVLIVARYYPGHGLGHVTRMVGLANYMAEHTANSIHLLTNYPLEALSIKINQRLIRSETLDRYRTAVFDSVYNIRYTVPRPAEEVELLNAVSAVTGKMVAMDYNRSDEYIFDEAINLFDHKTQSDISVNNKVHTDLDYVILRNEITSTKNTKVAQHTQPHILITLGAENQRALELLNVINGKSGWAVTVMEGISKSLIPPNTLTNCTFVPFTNSMGKYIKQSDLVVCNGGTTLLESLYIGNPIIAIPCNEFETTFIAHVDKQAGLYTLDDLDYLKDNYNNKGFRKTVAHRYQTVVTGKGKEKIVQILF